MKEGYKQTEIGVIPEDWEVSEIKDIGGLFSGDSPSKMRDGNIPYFKVDQLNNAYKYQKETPYFVQVNNPISTGSIIFPKRGAAIATNKIRIVAQDSFVDTNIMALTVTNEDINSEYIYYWLLRKGLSEIADTTSVPQINNKHIYPLKFPKPTLMEQYHIAKALSDIDELIDLIEKLIEKKKAIKQGAMQELLTGKRRLPGFSGDWKIVCLLEIGHFIKGSGISRADANSGKFPAVRYGELYTKHTDYVKSYYSHISRDVAATATPVTYGAILFAASGETKEEIGKCAAIIEDRTVYAGGDILIFIPDKPIHPVFLGTLLNTPEVCKQKAQRGQGDAIVHIHADSLSEIEVQIPEYDEQAAIADMLLSVDREIDLLEMKTAKMRQIKQGMMQQLLTGAIRLI